MVGLFEPVCAPWNVGGIPEDFSFGEIPPDWDRMGPYLEKAMARVPVSLEAGVRKFFCGPESFTPDLQPVVGEAPELQQLLRRGRPQLDRHPHRRRPRPGAGALDRRRPPGHRRHRHQHRPAAPLPGQPRVPAHPHRRVARAWSTSATTRPGRCRPRAAPSSRRCTTGWPRAARTSATSAAGRAPTGTPPEGAEPERRAAVVGPARTGSRYWEAEHHAAREGVILHGHVVHVEVPRAGPRRRARLLDQVSANQVDGDAGLITYTQWLNDGGTLEADLTVTKLDDDRFWVVASDTAHRHAETWMQPALRRRTTRSSPT